MGDDIDDEKVSDEKATRNDFRAAVNMTAPELRDWLDSTESKAVGQKTIRRLLRPRVRVPIAAAARRPGRS